MNHIIAGKPNPKAANDFARDFRILEIQRNIAKRAEKISELRAKLSEIHEINIIEDEVIINDEHVHLLRVDGCPDGIAISHADVLANPGVLDEGYKRMAELVMEQKNGNSGND